MFKLPITKVEELCRQHNLTFSNHYHPTVGYWHATFLQGEERECVADALDKNYAKAAMYASNRLEAQLKVEESFKDG